MRGDPIIVLIPRAAAVGGEFPQPLGACPRIGCIEQCRTHGGQSREIERRPRDHSHEGGKDQGVPDPPRPGLCRPTGEKLDPARQSGNDTQAAKRLVTSDTMTQMLLCASGTNGTTMNVS